MLAITRISHFINYEIFMSFENLDYLDQWNRVLRWYERLNEIYSGIPHIRPQPFYEDDIHAFFDNCFHLNDWLKNNNRPYLDFVTPGVSSEMMTCRDICIGDKHLTINYPSNDKNTKFTRCDISLFIGDPHVIKLRYYVNVHDDVIDVKDIADKCIIEWQDFLKLNNLIT